MEPNEIYLSDGAYAEFTGYSVILYTSDGRQRQNEVHLEPIAFKKLIAFLERKLSQCND